jgi:alanyl-tRNA synthetase
MAEKNEPPTPTRRWSGAELRAEFLRYFERHGHRVCQSYPLVPPNDPSLLFTNAGMVQFKDVFTGRETRDFKRAASSQKCVRAGGKHNDLENVGMTARHHTFFEMLGNFSFGDYFKRDALRFGWEFLVDVVGLPPERLWVTVFEGDRTEGIPADDEAAALWREVAGIRPERILRFGKKDNFWAMGETGPCGPCSEIHVHMGDGLPCHEPGGCLGVGCDCDRYIEVWNLVFMQFDRDSRGRLSPLPAPSIDTGMGLERLSAIVQGKTSNFDGDLFAPLLARMAEIARTSYGRDPTSDASLRVVADHARATAFLMADGVLPGNEGRGYVLRRIMRRAIRHGSKLGVDSPFLHRICLEVAEQMGGVYPELCAQRPLIEKASLQEEEAFRRTLGNGLKLLEREIAALDAGAGGLLPGKLVFDLQARDGFPPDLTALIAREHGLAIDEAGYQAEYARHQEVSAGGLGLEGVDDAYKRLLAEHGPSAFSGQDALEGEGVTLALLATGPEGRQPLARAESGQIVEALVSPSPMYGETGGQVGDRGWLEGPDGLRAEVLDVQRPLGALLVHRLRLEAGALTRGQRVRLRVDGERRQRIRLNHSATHLLQAALREVLGPHVNQKGSLVAPDRLRFDFSHFSALTLDELREVERRVNALIRANLPVEAHEAGLDEARAAGATMLFGEKYGARVRMVRMGDASLELCGGTHAARTGDIGLFHVLTEGGVQAGVRRIEALTGPDAVERLQEMEAWLQAAAAHLRSNPAQLAERAEALAERERKLAREVERLKTELATRGEAGGGPQEEGRTLAGKRILVTRRPGVPMASLREVAEKLRDQAPRYDFVLVASEQDGKLLAVTSANPATAPGLPAGAVLKEFFQRVGGKGGGRPDFAQGGGGDPARFDEAWTYGLIEALLKAEK